MKTRDFIERCRDMGWDANDIVVSGMDGITVEINDDTMWLSRRRVRRESWRPLRQRLQGVSPAVLDSLAEPPSK